LYTIDHGRTKEEVEKRNEKKQDNGKLNRRNDVKAQGNEKKKRIVPSTGGLR